MAAPRRRARGDDPDPPPLRLADAVSVQSVDNPADQLTRAAQPVRMVETYNMVTGQRVPMAAPSEPASYPSLAAPRAPAFPHAHPPFAAVGGPAYPPGYAGASYADNLANVAGPAVLTYIGAHERERWREEMSRRSQNEARLAGVHGEQGIRVVDAILDQFREQLLSNLR